MKSLKELFLEELPSKEDFLMGASFLGLENNLELFGIIWTHNYPPFWEKICLDKYKDLFPNYIIKYVVFLYDKSVKEFANPLAAVQHYFNILDKLDCPKEKYGVSSIIITPDDELERPFDSYLVFSYMNILYNKDKIFFSSGDPSNFLV